MTRKGNINLEQEETLKNLNMFFNGRNDAINFIEDYGSVILEAKNEAAEELKEQEETGIKILTPKQMFLRLLIALAQVKAGNNSESLLNEIRQISLFFVSITKESLKNIQGHNQIRTIKLHSIIKMDTIFMNPNNIQTSKLHVLILKFTDKIDLRRGENKIALSNLSIYYTWKNIKKFIQ